MGLLVGTRKAKPTIEIVMAPNVSTVDSSKAAMKFCRECGAKIPRESKHCEECGTRL